MPETVRIEPLVAWPREAAPGQTYLMTVDVRLAAGSEWRYGAEEYAVLCIVSAGRSCRVGPLGEAAVMLHRFGGSYGPAQFLLTAVEAAEDARLRLTLVNQAGMPIANVPLAMRIASDVAPVDAAVVTVPDTSRPSLESVLDAIARFEADRPSGVILVTGAAGAGKTTVARALVSRYGAAAFFANGEPIAPEVILADLHEQVTDDPIPTDPMDIFDVFEDLAEESTEPLRLVIDDLPPGIVEWLLNEMNPELPDGLFVVLTARSPAVGALLSGRSDVLTIGLSDALPDDPRAAAANDLGIQAKRSGDLDEAQEAWRRAADLGHKAGANNLGILLVEIDDLDDAEAAWRLAAALGDAAAANNLGLLRRRRRDLAGAAQAWQRAVELGHEEAASNLESVLDELRYPRPSPFVPRPRPVNSLPPSPGHLIDRADAVRRVKDCLREGRDVAIVGPPGIGKTHLALHVLSDEELTPSDGIVYLSAGLTAEYAVQSVFDQLFHRPEDATNTAIRYALGEVRIVLVLEAYAPDVIEELRRILGRSRFIVLSAGPAPENFERVELGGLPSDAVLRYLAPFSTGTAAGELLAEIAANSPSPTMLLEVEQQLQDAEPGSRSQLAAIGAGFERLAVEQQDRANPDNAERYYRRALDYWDKLGDIERAGEVAWQLGRLAEARGDLESAEGSFRQALRAWSEAGEELLLAGAHSALARLADSRGDLATAEEHYRRALEIPERLGDEIGAATARHQLASLMKSRGDLDAAESLLRQALESFERAGSVIDVGHVLLELGLLKEARGGLEEADHLLRSALERARLNNDTRAVAVICRHLGRLAERRGALDEAEGLYTHALETEQRLSNPIGLAASAAALANVAFKRGDAAVELAFRSWAAALDPETPTPEIARIVELSRSYGRDRTYGILAERVPPGSVDMVIEWLERQRPPA